MYFGSKKKKLNQFCIEEKKEEVSLSGMSNVLSAIVDSMRLQIKRIEKKKETAYNNYQRTANKVKGIASIQKERRNNNSTGESKAEEKKKKRNRFNYRIIHIPIER